MTQIEFLDQLGRELDGAAGRLIGHKRRSRVRGLVAPAAGLAVVVALAVTVWPSGPADPEREARPGSPQTPADVLGVLRRPERGADRGPAARQGREFLRRTLSGDAVFRLVGMTEEGKGIMIAAGSQVVRHGPGPEEAGVCLHYPDRLGGGGGACWTAADIAGGRAYGSQGEHLHGLVPDEIVAVHVDTLDDSRRLAVRDNFWALDGVAFSKVLSIVLEDAAGERTTVHALGVPTVDPVTVPAETLRKAEALAAAELVPTRKGGPIKDETRMLHEIGERIPQPPVRPEQLDPNRGSGRGASIVAFEAYAERRAACLWQRYWIAATRAGDEKVAGEALTVLKTVPRWPALREDKQQHELVAFAAANGLVGDVARDTARECND